MERSRISHLSIFVSQWNEKLMNLWILPTILTLKFLDGPRLAESRVKAIRKYSVHKSKLSSKWSVFVVVLTNI